MADELTTTAPTSRRQAQKVRTERALQQAALELFAKHGYDTTTTDEIAEQAGVSPRTFFRYFPTKESVLFVGELGWFQSFADQLLAQPSSLGDVEAIKATLVSLSPRLTAGRKALNQYFKAVASSATLRGGVLDRQADDIQTLSAAIATRRGLHAADEGCLILAHIVLVTYRRALTRWLAGKATVDPGDVITAELDLLVEQLTS